MKDKRFGKKQMVLGLMVLLLGAAVYLNYYVAANTPSVSTSTDTTVTTRALGESQFVNSTVSEPTDYFEAARQSRKAAREEALGILQETLRDVKLDEAAQQEALTAATAVAKAVEQEDAAESLIKAKGFADCVVYVEKDVCHVAVKAAELTEAQTLQISQIVMAQTGVTAQNLQILAVE